MTFLTFTKRLNTKRATAGKAKNARANGRTYARTARKGMSDGDQVQG